MSSLILQVICQVFAVFPKYEFQILFISFPVVLMPETCFICSAHPAVRNKSGQKKEQKAAKVEQTVDKDLFIWESLDAWKQIFNRSNLQRSVHIFISLHSFWHVFIVALLFQSYPNFIPRRLPGRRYRSQQLPPSPYHPSLLPYFL